MNLDDHAQSISTDDYVRARLQPLPRDVRYLHLRDLRREIDSIQTTARMKILDYGCGSSPYRTLFANADYKRADFLGTGDLDYQLGANSCVPEKDAQFDLILSTQVLEHVSEPQIYLSECFRLLKPGGKLFLTTHGTFEDHGCPYDFHRWTADGLNLALGKVGFQDPKIQKLTTGPRAVLFLMGALNVFYGKRRTMGSVFLTCYRHLFQWLRPLIHRMADSQLSHCSSVPANEPGHIIYICLAAQAQRVT